ncbi:leucyl aminopeptidase family protein [Aestuariibacter salexigens]|uniref:leucyl aminopeptidase family protein n=1 Tax=Aestuariibacter salexigens TaxID=226010 RepID=UPI0004270C93|nr:leucyl aminopeptidase family protein [Aestuariibacter salexigens]
MLRKFILVASVFATSLAYAMPSITFEEVDLPSLQTSAQSVVLFIDDAETLKGTAKQVDELTDGRLAQALTESEFSASLGATEVFFAMTPFSRITVIGTGTEPLNAPQLQDLGGYAAAALPTGAVGQPRLIADSLPTSVQLPQAYIAMGASLRDYHFDKYKKTESQTEPRRLVIHGAESESASALYNNDLRHVVEGVYLTRDMASEPGKSIYPQAFVEHVVDLFDDVRNVDIDVLDVRDMQKLNMGALLGVGKGSVHDSRLLVISYQGADKKQAPIALVGKGITFDTGGISLKSNNNMWQMKSDLAGAAAVAGTLLAIAKRGENVNVVGLMPLSENMPAQDAIRPGDVLTTMQGTTIEIISTDAEGRLILSDAVRYAQDKYAPRMLVNIATLTGSAARALSDEYAAVITRDWALSEKMMEIGNVSGEHVWPLPLHPNHFTQIKSDIADIKNSGAGNPGASIGAAVIGTFVDESLPWVHLDIAGVDWLSSSIPVAPAGSQGWGVRFMDQIVREYK